MIRAVCAFAVVWTAILPVSASPQQDKLWMHFDAADETLKEEGFKATKWRHRGELAQGGQTSFDITLEGGSSYQVVGICEDNCSDLAMYVSDASGNPVGSSAFAGSVIPSVPIASAGTYSVRVVMRACSSSPCAFGVKTYRK